jgi:hypothetical protein
MSIHVRESVTERMQDASMSVHWMTGVLVAALAAGSSCAMPRAPVTTSSAAPMDSPPSHVAPSIAAPRRGGGPIVLVTIDGARWQEIFDGTDREWHRGPRRSSRELVPNLERLARDHGAAVGAPGRGLIRATGPNFVSLPGYTEIMTGRAPIGCQDNTCATIAVPTFLDDAHEAGASVAAFGSWETLDRVVSSRPGAFTVSCGRAGDTTIDPFPGGAEFRPDRITGALALRHLETERPDVLYVGLGEPDEYAHRGDYAGYMRALGEADAFVGQIVAALERMGARGADTHLFVTADHGRSRDFEGHGGSAPESARVWLVASGPSITARGRVSSSHERHLADVAPTLRRLLGLTPADDTERPDDRDHGWRGQPLDELFAPAPEAQTLAMPTGQAIPSPPSPQ